MARPLLDAIEQDDTVGVFAYADEVRPLADLGHHSREELESAITRVPAPGFSESNLYDAILTLLDRMKPVEGRKAVLLLSTGIDTFSHATFEDVLKAEDAARTPVYAVAIGGLVERTVIGEAGPIAAIDWARATQQLRKLAAASGGRAYVRNTDLDIPAVYDDMMEHLRVRYIVKYTPPSPATSGHTPSVRVALVDPRTGKAIPAKIRIEKDDAAVS
jgi:VWFA-related protein